MPAAVSKKSTSTNTRFELPALKLDFGSITDGTNIPPPLDSPVQKIPAPITTEIKSGKKEEKNGHSANGNGQLKSNTSTNGNLAGIKRPAEDLPHSPVALGRPGSLRRFFSRTKLNNTYAEGPPPNGNEVASSRPASRSGSSFMDDRKSKRGSGWFRRLREGGSRRSSLMFEDASAKKQPGSLPPMIPELGDLIEKDEGGLGNDLFKNIK